MTTRSFLLALILTAGSASLFATETPSAASATPSATTPPKLQVSLPSYDARIRALLDVAPAGIAPETVVATPRALEVPAELRAATNVPDGTARAPQSASHSAVAPHVASL